MSWLARPLVCENEIVLDGLDPRKVTDGDLKTICFRMDVILASIEMERCGGRLLPIDLFDRISTLKDMVLYGRGGCPKLADWAGLIKEFGDYYSHYLAGDDPISVDPETLHEEANWYQLSVGE